MSFVRLPITPWQRMHVSTTCVLSVSRVCWGCVPAISRAGIASIAASSLSSCAKKTGSRPASPIGDQRHSPYSETLTPTGPVGAGDGGVYDDPGANHMTAPGAPPDDAL